ncbi:MAG: ribonuclease HII [Patescibacteria group bacterium]|nr:ribonuclease HII [Patescibacteria group bacterium]
MARILIGIDEAGRAPLAGPVSVGFVAVPEKFDVLKEFPGVRDSKKLSPERREALYELLLTRAHNGDVRFCVRFSSHKYIDRFGITKAVYRAIKSGVQALAPQPEDTHILLDGLLHAPRQYSQETVIHGDDLIPLISLASIVAKVRRDHLMERMSRLFPGYGFSKHKGYPTKEHYKTIEHNGLCDIHRRSFCSKVKGIV